MMKFPALWRLLWAALLLLPLIPEVWAQNAIQQLGPVVPGNLPMWAADGYQQDSGVKAGVGASPLTTSDGTNTVPNTTTQTFGSAFVVGGSGGSATINLKTGGVPNSALANSSVTINSHNLALGGTLVLGFADFAGTVAPSQLPNPTASTLGGIESITPTAHQWIDSVSTLGVPHQSQPGVGDLSGLGSGVATALGIAHDTSGGICTVGGGGCAGGSATGFGVDGGTNIQTINNPAAGAATINNNAEQVDIASLNAATNLTLPAISALTSPTSTCIRFHDNNQVSGTNTLTITAGAADSINGGATGGNIGPYSNGNLGLALCASATHNWNVFVETSIPASSQPNNLSFASSIDINGLHYTAVPTATTGQLGVVKPDGSTITISGGVISSTGGGGGTTTPAWQQPTWSYLHFSSGVLTSLPATTKPFAFKKVNIQSLVDNLTVESASFTCSVNPTISLQECGTSATCSSPTTLASATLTAADTAVSATPVLGTKISQGDYVAWQITAGTCTALDVKADASVHSAPAQCGVLEASYITTCGAIAVGLI